MRGDIAVSIVYPSKPPACTCLQHPSSNDLVIADNAHYVSLKLTCLRGCALPPWRG